MLNINKSLKNKTSYIFFLLGGKTAKKVYQFLLTIIQMYKFQSVRTNEAGFFETKIQQRLFDGNYTYFA